MSIPSFPFSFPFPFPPQFPLIHTLPHRLIHLIHFEIAFILNLHIFRQRLTPKIGSAQHLIRSGPLLRVHHQHKVHKLQCLRTQMPLQKGVRQNAPSVPIMDIVTLRRRWLGISQMSHHGFVPRQLFHSGPVVSVWSAAEITNLAKQIQLTLAIAIREGRVHRQHLHQHTRTRPNVNGVAIPRLSHQDLGWTVPAQVQNTDVAVVRS